MEKLEGFQPSTSIEKEPNTSVRLKVTDRCPWECTFCHSEGSGEKIMDVDWSEELKNNIDLLKERMSLSEVHYTGGEPTQNKKLEEITAGLTSMGLEVKTTTNAQFSEEKMDKLIENGLSGFNFSLHALNAPDFLKTQHKQDEDWADKNIAKQREMIHKAVEKGSNVKINTVLSTQEDIEKAMEIYEFAKENELSARFLNDLGNGEEAVNAIDEMVLERIGAQKFKEKVVKGSSSKTSYYRDKDGFEFGVKEIREQKVASLCKDCQEDCTEQFYGVRLEQREDGYYVRLCLDRDDEKSIMPLEDFLESQQLEDINQLINE